MNINSIVRKYKFELIIAILSIAIIAYNGYLYINTYILDPLYANKSVNVFSFWQFVKIDGIGMLLLFSSPVLIMMISCYNFYQKLYSKNYHYYFLRSNKNDFLSKNIIFSYIKAICFIPTVSLIIFIVGKILLPNNFLVKNGEIIGCTLDSFCNKPNLYVFISILNNVFYSIICCNVFLFFQTKFKELYKIIISSFLFVFISNYVLYFVFFFVFKITKLAIFDIIASSIELYQGYHSDINITITLIYLVVWFALTTIFIYFRYKNYLEVVEVYE